MQDLRIEVNERECIYEPKILKHRKLFFIFSIISILIPVIALLGIFIPVKESLGDWFQRSGATMSMFAILAEVRLIEMGNVLNPTGLVESTFTEVVKKYSPQIKLYKWIATVLIVLGTIIWGYGDLIID